MAHAGVGSVSFTTCLLLNSIMGVKPTVGALSGHRSGDERADRRPGRLHVRPDRQRGAADQGRHHQDLWRSARRNAIRRCRKCRPPRRPACRNSRPRPGTRLFAPKGTPKPVIDKLSAALDKALDDEATRKRLLDLGSDIPGKDRRGPAGVRKARGERDRTLGAGDQGLGRDAISAKTSGFGGKGGLDGRPFSFAEPPCTAHIRTCSHGSDCALI